LLANGKRVSWLVRSKVERYLTRKRWGKKPFRETCRFWQRKHNRSQPASYQIQLHAKGLCIRCGKPARGFWHCDICRGKIQARKKIWRQKRKAGGLPFM